jgi:hypothetical protein
MENDLKQFLNLLTAVVADLVTETATLMEQSTSNLGTSQAREILDRAAQMQKTLDEARKVLLNAR